MLSKYAESIQQVGVEQGGVCKGFGVDVGEGRVPAASLLLGWEREVSEPGVPGTAYSLPTAAPFHHHIKFCRSNTCKILQPVSGGPGA